MKRAALFLFLLAALNGCGVDDHYHADHTLCATTWRPEDDCPEAS